MPSHPPKRPRRKAKQERARQTVEVILEAAARVLEKRRYSGATTNRIAETAGVSVGTLYEYFADKDAIFEALIQKQIEAIVSAIRAQGPDPDLPVGIVLEQVLRLAMGAMPRGPGYIRALEQVPASTFRRRLSAARAQVVAYVRQLLEEHRDELRVTDLDLAALLVVSSAEGVAMNASDGVFGEPLAKEMGSLLNLYLTGREAPRG
jgi:AcrR family transcriptional regulator